MQKEKLSALMDGETLDQSLLSALAKDESLQKSWESYHLIRDTMRGNVADIIHLNISSRVADAVAQESAKKVTQLIPESQPEPARWRRKPWFAKSGTWSAQLAQVGVAACVSLAVIAGVQHYNHPSEASVTADSQDSPAFNTMPMIGKASPVSLGIQGEMFDNNRQTQKVQQQRVRINAMLQDYELHRRLNDGAAETASQHAGSVQR